MYPEDGGVGFYGASSRTANVFRTNNEYAAGNSIIPDPTVQTMIAYDMTYQEIILGWFLMALIPWLYLLSKTLHPYDGPPVPEVTRTPEYKFDGIIEPYEHHYLHVFDRVHQVILKLVSINKGQGFRKGSLSVCTKIVYSSSFLQRNVKGFNFI